MLSWHILWMSHHARAIIAELREVGKAVQLGQRFLFALAAVVAVAAMREGSEVVLFLYGIIAASHTSAAALTLGDLACLAAACFVLYLLYRGLVTILLHCLFSVTNWLIALLAAGMAGQAASILHGADLLPGWGEHLWNTSFLLSDDSYLGRSMHVLIGYSARPYGIQLAAYLLTLLVLIVSARVISGSQSRMMRAPLVALITLIIAAPMARADDVPVLVFDNHRFEPATIQVPANTKFKLMVKNTDDTADEFESVDPNREKLVPPGQTITVFLGLLSPGTDKFFGDFLQDTAQCAMVAR